MSGLGTGSGATAAGGIQERALAVSIALGAGDSSASVGAAAPSKFSGTSSNTVNLTGLRCAVTIDVPGGASSATAVIRLWGMQQSLMQQLSSLGTLASYYVRNNVVTVSAGVAGSPLSVCFTGVINEAFADFAGAPDVSFVVTALANSYQQVRPVPPTSQAGSVDVAQLLAGLATQMGLVFENNGVAGIKLPGAYYYGAPMTQARDIAHDAGIVLFADGASLAIWPPNGNRGGAIPLISKDTGLVGYPQYSGFAGQIRLRTLYNPSIRFGGLVQLKSTVSPQANGMYQVTHLSHDLAALMPDGPWFTDIEASPPMALA